ncbi:MAG: 4-hydroxybenzoate octaprenyltransferase, partial [Planctomycetota bacterium]
MLKTLSHLLSLIRFSHTLFALPFALLAALMAWRSSWYFDAYKGNTYISTLARHETTPPLQFWQELLGILLCMVFARSTAMAFNRVVDRKIDAENPRTAGRHLPAGKLSLPQVNLFTLLCAMSFVASTALFLPNRLPMYLSMPVLLFLCGYSYTKRFTPLAHFWLGAALAMSPIAAWIAIRGEAVMANPADLLPAVVLGGAVMTWVAGFDILYACQDYAYDKQAGLRSIPTALGVPGALRLAAICHAATAGLLALLPCVYPPFGVVYWVGVAAVAVLLIYE